MTKKILTTFLVPLFLIKPLTSSNLRTSFISVEKILTVFLSLFFLLFSFSFAESTASGIQENMVDITLNPQYQQLARSGDSFLLGVRFTMKPGWHIYWRNPGDSGAPPKIVWSKLTDVYFSDVHWPTPGVMLVGSLVNIGYEGTTVLPVRVTYKGSQDSTLTSIPLDASVEYLVCKEDCIPGSSQIHLDMPLGESSVLSDWDVELRDRLEQSPHQTPLTLLGQIQKKALVITLPLTYENAVRFIPYQQGIVDLSNPSLSKTRSTLRLDFDADLDLASLESIPGIIVLPDGRSTEVIVAVDSTRASSTLYDVAQSNVLAGGTASPETFGIFLLSFYALLGGIILNAMPCVFPIIGIKILQFTNYAQGSRRALVRQGVFFSFGIITSMWVLSGLLFSLRYFGIQNGWGFQLQYPPFVLGLIFLFSFLSAHLLGLVTFGESLQIQAGKIESGKGAFGAFSSGVLTTMVATPCSAPFMGTAIGAALGLPIWQGFIIFTMLGLGIALPYLVLCSFPSVTRLMPKPGAWMEILKELLAFPLLATVIWLLYVLGLQTDLSQVIWTLVGILFSVFAFFILELSQRAKFTYFFQYTIFLLFLALGMGTAISGLVMQKEDLTITAKKFKTDQAVTWQPFDRVAVSKAKDAGNIVFIDFTAAWCITCQLNKKAVLETSKIEDFFLQHNVQLFRADWTSTDDAITLALKELGRQSVPTNVLYWGKNNSHIFPTILTKELMLEKLSEAVSSGSG
jgi:thiol:disulfide interchange protein/DsbC/DsbD-like thiol-disulfide interchange protein